MIRNSKLISFQIRFINTVKYIVQGLSEYQIDVSDVDTRIVKAADQCNKAATLYYVRRTTVGKMLPVYVNYRYDKSKKLTIIRRIDGDVKALCDELSLFFPVEKIDRKRINDTIRISGNYGDYVKHFLTLRGF